MGELLDDHGQMSRVVSQPAAHGPTRRKIARLKFLCKAEHAPNRNRIPLQLPLKLRSHASHTLSCNVLQCHRFPRHSPTATQDTVQLNAKAWANNSAKRKGKERKGKEKCAGSATSLQRGGLRGGEMGKVLNAELNAELMDESHFPWGEG
jgi:hypothetical protein